MTKETVPVDMSIEQKDVARGTIFGLIGGFSSKFISFIYTILLARMFLQADLGIFNLALAIIGIYAAFSDLGIGAAIARFIPYYIGRKENDKVYSILWTSYIYAGASSLIFVLFTVISASKIAGFYKIPQLTGVLEILGIYIICNTFVVLNSAVLSGFKNIKQYNLVYNTQNLLKLIGTLIFFFLAGSNAYSITLGFTISYLLIVILSFYFVGKILTDNKIKKINVSFDEQINILKELMPIGLTLSVLVIFGTIISGIDVIMMGYLLSPALAKETINTYSFATNLAALILIFSSAVGTIFLPVLSEMYGKAEDKLSKQMISTTTMRWIIFLSVPLTALFITYPADILQIFYGSSYIGGAAVLAICSVGMFICAMSTVYYTILASMRMVKIELYAAGVAMMINVILNYLLIPIYGMNGSAIASSVCFFIVSILLIWYSKKLVGFGFPKEFLRPLAAAIITIAILIISHVGVLQLISNSPNVVFGTSGLLAIVIQKIEKLFILGILFVIVSTTYFIMLSILRCFENEDRALIGAVLKRTAVPANIVKIIQELMGGKNNC